MHAPFPLFILVPPFFRLLWLLLFPCPYNCRSWTSTLWLFGVNTISWQISPSPFSLLKDFHTLPRVHSIWLLTPICYPPLNFRSPQAMITTLSWLPTEVIKFILVITVNLVIAPFPFSLPPFLILLLRFFAPFLKVWRISSNVKNNFCPHNPSKPISQSFDSVYQFFPFSCVFHPQILPTVPR